jgi:hypothetical protein
MIEISSPDSKNEYFEKCFSKLLAMKKEKSIRHLLLTWILIFSGIQLGFLSIFEFDFIKNYHFHFSHIKWAILILFSILASSFGPSLLMMHFHVKENPKYKNNPVLGILSLILMMLLVSGFYFEEGFYIILFESFMAIIISLKLFSFLGFHYPRNRGNMIFFGSIGTISCLYGWSALIFRRSGWGLNYAMDLFPFAFITALIVIFANLLSGTKRTEI